MYKKELKEKLLETEKILGIAKSMLDEEREENKRLKEENRIINLKYLDMCEQDNDKEKVIIKLCERIGKAIEYIENKDIDVCTIRNNDIWDTKEELLEILQGEDND